MNPDFNTADYNRVAEAISYLRQNFQTQPELDGLAGHLGLSTSHVQRLFTRWAGVSPKRFTQYLTVQYAKQQMQQTSDLLDLSYDCGLSGSGRLHDLFVSMEAMSPGEFKTAACGVEIRWGVGETPFGIALIAFADRGICHLSFLEDDGMNPAAFLSDLWPQAVLSHQNQAAVELLQSLFNPESGNKPLRLWVSGTNFQIQVWRALLNIPAGGILNYQRVAAMIDKPKASRAVGSAVGNNPVAFLIPCHRVLRGDGELGQYHWGAERKAAILGWEAATLQEQQR